MRRVCRFAERLLGEFFCYFCEDSTRSPHFQKGSKSFEASICARSGFQFIHSRLLQLFSRNRIRKIVPLFQLRSPSRGFIHYVSPHACCASLGSIEKPL